MEKALTVNGKRETKGRYESQIYGLDPYLVNLNTQGFLDEGGTMDM